MKRILVVILLFALVPGTLLAQKKESGKVRTLVIDPGHGGEANIAKRKTLPSPLPKISAN